MTPFELVEPPSLAEAINLMDRDDPAIRPIAGGTALMLMMKTGLFKPLRLVSLRGIEPRFAQISVAADGALHIGAMTRLGVIERSAEVARHAPVIIRALRRLSNVRVRNVAMIGGHLAHADPHMDLPPVLIALGAHITITGLGIERTIPLEALFTGYYETLLRHNELITDIIIPAQGQRRAAYFKCTARSADDWPALGVAAAVIGNDRMVEDARLVIGAATEKPIRLKAAEAILRGAAIDEAALRRAGDAAADEAPIVSDQHGSAPYKKQLLRVHVGRAVRAALAPAGVFG